MMDAAKNVFPWKKSVQNPVLSNSLQQRKHLLKKRAENMICCWNLPEKGLLRKAFAKWEFDLEKKERNEAACWHIARQVCGAVKGTRKAFRRAPQCRPTSADLFKKYEHPATKGGWGAIEYEGNFDLEGKFEETPFLMQIAGKCMT
eukprot:12411476-Karenia_brevis.AAC.1